MFKGVVTVLGSIGIKEDVDSSTRSVRAGVCRHKTPTPALISHEAADTMIPAVWRLSAAHHGLSAMPATRTLLACSLHAGARRHRTPAHAGVFMNFDDHG